MKDTTTPQTSKRTTPKRGRITTSQREAMARQQLLDAQVGTSGDLYEYLFTFRESDKGAHAEMDELMQLGLQPYRGTIPGVDIVLGHGAKLLARTTAGEELRAQYNAMTLYGGAGRSVVGYLLVVEGTAFLLSLFSATKTNLDDTNDFTKHLTNIIKAHRVRNLYTGPVTRLMRSRPHGQELMHALRDVGTAVFPYSRRPIDFTKAPAEAEKEMVRWIDESVNDRDYTVERLTRGVLGTLARGHYPKSWEALPGMGYTFRKTAPGARRVDRTPVPDKAMVPVVRDLLTWGATNMSDLDIAKKLAEVHGWGSPTLRQRLGNPKATIMDMEHPENAVRSLWAQLDLFETGTYTYTSRVAVEHDQLRMDDTDSYKRIGGQTFVTRELSFHHDELDEDGNAILPGGVWVDKKTMAKCRQKRDPRAMVRNRTPQGRQASNTDRRPLAGLSEWEDETYAWQLTARYGINYKLARRTLAAAVRHGRRAGWNYKNSETVATIDPAELHRNMATAIVEAIDKHGTQVRRPNARPGVDGTAAAQEAVQRAKEKLAVAEKAVRQAGFRFEAAQQLLDADDNDANRAGYLAALGVKQAADHDLRTAEKEVADAHGAVQTSTPLTKEAAAVLDDLAAAMALLRECEYQAPAKLNVALRIMLRGLRFAVSTDGLYVDGSVYVLLGTTDEGPIELGPITFRAQNRVRVAGELRRDVLLTGFMRDGKSLQEVAADANVTEGIARRRIAEELQATGLFPAKQLRTAIVDCPVADVRRVLWAAIDADANGTKFQAPTGVTKEYAAHIVKTYVDVESKWGLSWCADDATMARSAVQAVRTAGRKGMDWQTLLETIAPDLAEGGAVRGLGIELVVGKGSDKPDHCVQHDPVLRRSEVWHARGKEGRRVWLRTCPFCETQTLTHVLRVPEVPGGMLCTKCAHAPALPAVKFPADYLRNWVGPRGYGKTVAKGQRAAGTREAQ
jgi:hypothetical protein